MNEKEYYEMPYGVCDRIELQQFLIADHHEGIARAENKEHFSEPQTQEEIFKSMVFALTHNV